jgi:putative ABC transport system permease protein
MMTIVGSAWRDLGLGCRLLKRDVIVTSVALSSLALGIGVNTSVFSTLYTVAYKPLPFVRSDSLVQLHASRTAPTAIDTPYLSGPVRDDIVGSSRSLGEIASYAPVNVTMTGVDEPRTLAGLQVSGEFFHVYGVEPLRGRWITSADIHSDYADVAVLSQDAWEKIFGGDPNAVERTIYLSVLPQGVVTPYSQPGVPFRVIGVMPAAERFPVEGDLWLPLPSKAYTSAMGLSPRAIRRLNCIARVRPNFTVRQADDEVHLIGSRLAAQYADTDGGWDLGARSLLETIGGRYRNTLIMLLGAVALILLLTCVSISGLLLARGRNRRREMSIRAVLGATRWRLCQQLLLESLVLSGLAALLSTLVGVECQAVLRTIAPAGLPRVSELGFNWPVFAYLLSATLVCGVALGIAPVHQLAEGEFGSSIREHRTASPLSQFIRSTRLRGILIGFELAVAFPIVMAALLVLASFRQLSTVDLGFRRDNVLMASVKPSSVSCAKLVSCLVAVADMKDRIAGISGVHQVAIAGTRPLSSGLSIPISLNRDWNSSKSDAAITEFQVISPDYFTLLQIPLKQGRWFSDLDTRESPPVAVVNETFGKRLGPGVVIGQQVNLAPAGRAVLLDIIGVAGDVRDVTPAVAAKPTLYVPLAQASLIPKLSFLVKTNGSSNQIELGLRQAVRSVDGNAAVSEVTTLERIADEKVADQRFAAVLLDAFGALSVVLALLGTYGLITYAVSSRVKEFGIRRALGATQRDITHLVVGEGLSTVGWSLTFGIGGAIVAGRLVQSLLFGTAPFDPKTMSLVTLLILITAGVGYYIPARRAAQVDPWTALKRE